MPGDGEKPQTNGAPTTGRGSTRLDPGRPFVDETVRVFVFDRSIFDGPNERRESLDDVAQRLGFEDLVGRLGFVELGPAAKAAFEGGRRTGKTEFDTALLDEIQRLHHELRRTRREQGQPQAGTETIDRLRAELGDANRRANGAKEIISKQAEVIREQTARLDEILRRVNESEGLVCHASNLLFGYLHEGGPLCDKIRPGSSLIRDGIPALAAEIDRLKKELEQTRVQLAAAGVAAMGGAAADKVGPENYGWSASFGDVRKLRAEADQLRELIVEYDRTWTDYYCVGDILHAKAEQIRNP